MGALLGTVESGFRVLPIPGQVNRAAVSLIMAGKQFVFGKHYSDPAQPSMTHAHATMPRVLTRRSRTYSGELEAGFRENMPEPGLEAGHSGLCVLLLEPPSHPSDRVLYAQFEIGSDPAH